MDRYDIPSMLAGFSLSMVLGAALYIYLTVG
jgi:hypothetical protein